MAPLSGRRKSLTQVRSPHLGHSPAVPSPSTSLLERTVPSKTHQVTKWTKVLNVILLICVLSSALLYSGLLFGWVPLQISLLREKQYADLCPPPSNHTNFSSSPGSKSNSTKPCKAQLDQLNLVYTLGTVLISAVSLPGGLFLDAFGPSMTIFVAGIFEVAGLIMFAIADSQTLDLFIPASCAMAVGGLLSMLAAFPVSFRFQSYQPAILAAISCLFDASSIIFNLVNRVEIWKPTVYTRERIFFVYAGVAVLLYTALTILWAVTTWSMERQLKKKANAQQQEESPERKSLIFNQDNYRKSKDIFGNNESMASSETLLANPMEHDLDLQTLPYDTPDCNDEYRVVINNEDNELVDNGSFANDQVNNDYQKLNDGSKQEAYKYRLLELPLKKQLWTYEFFFIATFASLQMLRANTYIGMNNDILTYYHDTNDVYKNIFGWVLPAGIIFVPFIDGSVHYVGVKGTLWITMMWGFIYGGLVLIPSPLYVQIGVFFSFTCFRAFLYATMSTFICQRFGLNTLGRMTGFVFSTSAIVNLLQYPIVAYTHTQGGNPFVANVGLLLLPILLIPMLARCP
eukprot:g3409.t1